MKVLVTGGAGYIGSHTSVRLLENGYEVIIADNFYNSSPGVIDKIEIITGKRPKLYECDIRSRDELRAVFKKEAQTGEIDFVIHFAGYKAVGELL